MHCKAAAGQLHLGALQTLPPHAPSAAGLGLGLGLGLGESWFLQ